MSTRPFRLVNGVASTAGDDEGPGSSIWPTGAAEVVEVGGADAKKSSSSSSGFSATAADAYHLALVRRVGVDNAATRQLLPMSANMVSLTSDDIAIGQGQDRSGSQGERRGTRTSQSS